MFSISYAKMRLARINYKCNYLRGGCLDYYNLAYIHFVHLTWLKWTILHFKICGSGGIRTHASEETGALNQRLRPLGHATYMC